MSEHEDPVELIGGAYLSGMLALIASDYPEVLGKALDRALKQVEEQDDQWVEWGVRRSRGDVGSVVTFRGDYRLARTRAREWRGTLVSRVVSASSWESGGRDASQDDDGPEGQRGAASGREGVL